MNTILFDCERMKYEDTGIYYYCLHLGTELLKQSDPRSEHIAFYLPRNAAALFGRDHVPYHRLHKVLLPDLSRFNIWHSTFQHSDYVPLLNRRIKVVQTIHDLNFIYDEQLSDRKKRRYLLSLQKRVDRADVLVCISEYAKKDLLTFCNTAGKQISVIHNGSNALDAPLLKPGSYKPQRPFLFSIGTIHRKKNFHCLLSLVKNNLHFDLVIAGKPEDRAYMHELQSLAKEQGVQDNLHMVGRITESEKSWYYHNCKAFLMPSVSEGFGLPLVEAMSVGKPVFLSNKTALPEIGSSAAFYFNDFSEEHMQASFQKGIQHYERNNMTELIKKRAESFSWQKAAEQYLRIYQSLNTHR